MTPETPSAAHGPVAMCDRHYPARVLPNLGGAAFDRRSVFFGQTHSKALTASARTRLSAMDGLKVIHSRTVSITTSASVPGRTSFAVSPAASIAVRPRVCLSNLGATTWTETETFLRTIFASAA